MLPLQGIAQGAQPISSYNYGAKNTNRVKKTFRLLLMTCLSYSALLWAAVQLIPRVFVSIFTADASLINFTAPMLRIYLGGLFLFGIQIACQMLAESKASITEVGAACGMGNSSYFGKVFREVVGCTPRQYRYKRQNNNTI